MPSEAKGWQHRGRSGQSSHDPPMVPRADPCGAQSDGTALYISPGPGSAAALASPTTLQLVLRAPPERLQPAVVRPVGRGHQQSGAGGRVDPNRVDALVRAVRPPLVRRVVPRVTSTTTAPGWTTGRSVQSSKYLRTMTARCRGPRMRRAYAVGFSLWRVGQRTATLMGRPQWDRCKVSLGRQIASRATTMSL